MNILDAMLFPTISRAAACGWRVLHIHVAGAPGALVAVISFIHTTAPAFLDVELTALHIDDSLFLGTMFASVLAGDQVLLAGKVGEFLMVAAQ